MPGDDRDRERHFEAVIGLMLDALANSYPEQVQVSRAPLAGLEGAADPAPAFELVFPLGEGRLRCLVSCLPEVSDATLERLAGARPRLEDRLKVVYPFDRTLSEEQFRMLDEAGIEHHSLVGFGVFLDEVNRALAATSGLASEAVFRLELMKAGRRYPALRTAFSRMRSERSFAAQVGD